MNKPISLVLSLMLLGGLVAGCTSGPPKEYTDANQTIEIGVGEKFIIALESNPTTGYGWETAFDSSYLEQVDSKYTATQTKSAMVGSGGTQRFTFEGLKAGTTEPTLTYKRSWEQDFAKQHTFTVHIK